MLITSRVTFDIDTGRVLARDCYDYDGPLELACGASAAQTAAQQNEANLSNSLMSDFSTVFGQNQNILGSITQAFQPIIAAGPNQQGFSPAELTSMQTQATDATSQGAQNAQIAAAAKNATTGGSNLPSGVQEQIQASLNNSAAQENAREQGAITQANYATGRQNFFNAVGGDVSASQGLEGAASNFAGQTNSANQAALAGADQIAAANRAWEAPVFGLLGSALGVATGNPAALLGGISSLAGGGNTGNVAQGSLPIGPAFGSGLTLPTLSS
jgi:hypothetical protein